MAPELGLGDLRLGQHRQRRKPARHPALDDHRALLRPRPGGPAASAITQDQARAYEGDFLTTRRAYGGLEGFTTASIGRASVRATPDGRLTVIDGGVSTLFNGTDKPGVFKAVDSGRWCWCSTPMVTGLRASTPRAASRPIERIGFFRSAGLLIWTSPSSPAWPASPPILGVASFRNRREARQTPVQARAAQMQTMQAVLWLISAGCVGVFGAKASDQTKVFYGWPSGWLLSGSACALVAALLSIA
jgi:hypothetical protein